MALLKDQVSGN